LLADMLFNSAGDMSKVDQIMVGEYDISLLQMMENAGRNLAALARDRFFNGDVLGKQIVVLAGTGGNGGGAFVCARRLLNWGATVHIFLTKSLDNFKNVPLQQLAILQNMGALIKVGVPDKIQSDLIIDGIIGYSLSGAPRGPAKKLIQWANSQTVPILSLDVPAGINTTNGSVSVPSIIATTAMILALPKKGFDSPKVKSFVGELYIADIPVPLEIYKKIGITFKKILLVNKQDIVRLW
jgi:NAD(P)H-hydrate epimerase